ncbi:glycerate kinase [Luteolibacter sp. AS25]|uniref:glycerate kinase n=1 Tax=Luteolibacter sp. AS25 TaxID=3135776 RepID=UPI00398B67D3
MFKLSNKTTGFLDQKEKAVQKHDVNIVIAPDKFKGALTGSEAASAIQAGFAKFFPDAKYTLLPLADGGEGIIEAFSKGTDSFHTRKTVTVQDALRRAVETEFLFIKYPVKTAVIESANANGLWRISSEDRDIGKSSTFGVGQLIREAIGMSVRRIIIGIGGSATNDAGIGMAAALGYRFLDTGGNEVDPIPANFLSIAKIDATDVISLPEITVACDVGNPLLGEQGATAIYGPQKGLLPEEAETSEAALAHVARIIYRELGTDFKESSGAGAAGGLGFGLMSFCNARLECGFDCVASAVGAEEIISCADFVVTAEGSLDAQTLNGKVPFGIAKLARKHRAPVYALAGRVVDDEQLFDFFDGISTILNGPMSTEEAIANAPKILESGAARLAHQIFHQEKRWGKKSEEAENARQFNYCMENKIPYVL